MIGQTVTQDRTVAGASIGRALVLLAVCLVAGCSGPESPPTVILISVDTLRADHLGAYGYSRPTSPNVDAFAAEALVFDNALAHASETISSISSILTGFLPHETRAPELYALPFEVETLPEMLAKDGWDTVAVVSNYVIRSTQGFAQGFSVYDETMDEREAVRGMPERIAGPTTDRAIELLREHSGGPLFMWVHYQDPHATYTPPDGFAESFAEFGAEPRPLAANELMSGRGGIPAHQVLGEHRDYHHYVTQYDGEILYFDEQFGRLIETLKELGVYDDALILFTSDHGENMGEHDYYFTHGENLDHAVTRVPMIVRQGSELLGRRAEYVQHADIVPTVLAFTGVEVDLPFRGDDLRSPVAGREIFSETRVWWSREKRMHAVTREGMKLVHRPDANLHHLYDLNVDPGETRDLFYDPDRIPLGDALKEALARLRDEDLLDLGEVVAPGELTEEELEKLRSLGYVR